MPRCGKVSQKYDLHLNNANKKVLNTSLHLDLGRILGIFYMGEKKSFWALSFILSASTRGSQSGVILK